MKRGAAPPLGRQFAAIGGLETAEVLRSRWFLFAFALYTLLAGVFVLVGLRESVVLGFTGMGRVLFSFCHALVTILPLLALTATGQTLASAREGGTLELLFSHPLSRLAYFASVTLARVAVLVAPLVLLLGAMTLYGRLVFHQAVDWGFLLRSLGVSLSLILCFTGIGMLIAAHVRSQARAMIWILGAWATTIALMDFGLIGLMLQWRLNPQSVFALAALNPVQDARMALLSAADPELSTLGPVGFFLAHRLGGGFLLFLGLTWPTVLGLLCWGLGYRRFRDSDLV